MYVYITMWQHYKYFMELKYHKKWLSMKKKKHIFSGDYYTLIIIDNGYSE